MNDAVSRYEIQSLIGEFAVEFSGAEHAISWVVANLLRIPLGTLELICRDMAADQRQKMVRRTVESKLEEFPWLRTELIPVLNDFVEMIQARNKLYHGAFLGMAHDVSLHLGRPGKSLKDFGEGFEKLEPENLKENIETCRMITASFFKTLSRVINDQGKRQ